jgi:hypothetical protein
MKPRLKPRYIAIDWGREPSFSVKVRFRFEPGKVTVMSVKRVVSKAAA